jgi:hypothetical protein
VRKAPRHIWRIRRKYLSVYGEYGEFRVVCCTKNHLRIQRIRGKNLYIHGENAKRLSAYSPNKARDVKLRKLISVNK